MRAHAFGPAGSRVLAGPPSWSAWLEERARDRRTEPLHRFALTVGEGHYVVEARDRAEAQQIAGEAFIERDTTAFRWATQQTPVWREAWRDGRVITIGRTNSTEFEQIE